MTADRMAAHRKRNQRRDDRGETWYKEMRGVRRENACHPRNQKRFWRDPERPERVFDMHAMLRDSLATFGETPERLIRDRAETINRDLLAFIKS